MMSRIFFIWMAMVICAAPFSAASAPVTDRVSKMPADLIEEGLANNPGIKSLAARVDALKAEAMAAGILDDPKIGFGLMNLPVDSFSFRARNTVVAFEGVSSEGASSARMGMQVSSTTIVRVSRVMAITVLRLIPAWPTSQKLRRDVGICRHEAAS